MARQIKLGLMIDYYRKREKLTLTELGRKLDKSPSAISRWIAGERSPMIEDLVKMVDLFETDVNTLLFGFERNDKE